MEVQLAYPIAAVHGMLDKKSDYYLTTRNGKTYLRHRPRKTAKVKKAMKSPKVINQRERFKAITQLVTEVMHSQALKAHYEKMFREQLKSRKKPRYSTLRGFVFGQFSQELREGIGSTR